MKAITGVQPIRLKDLQPAIINSAIIQAVLLILGSLIMDTGIIFSFFLFAVAAHWIVFTLIALQRRNNLTATDRVLLTGGFAIYLVCLPLLGWTVHIIDLALHR